MSQGMDAVPAARGSDPKHTSRFHLGTEQLLPQIPKAGAGQSTGSVSPRRGADLGDVRTLGVVCCLFLVKTRSSSTRSWVEQSQRMELECRTCSGMEGDPCSGCCTCRNLHRRSSTSVLQSQAREMGTPRNILQTLLSYGRPARNCSRKNLLEAEQRQGCAPAQLSPWGVHPPGFPPWICSLLRFAPARAVWVMLRELLCCSRNALPASFPSLKNYPCREGISEAQGKESPLNKHEVGAGDKEHNEPSLQHQSGVNERGLVMSRAFLCPVLQPSKR